MPDYRLETYRAYDPYDWLLSVFVSGSLLCGLVIVLFVLW